MTRRWTFDDYRIGLMSRRGSTLDQDTTVLARPRGLRVPDWYVLAGQICDLLNKNGVDHVEYS